MAIGTAAAILGASAIGAGASMFGASKASKAQTKAGERSIEAQREMFDIVRKSLEPFIGAGKAGADMLPGMAADPYFSKPIDMTVEGLEKTPGYQFIRDQGLKSTQNRYAAKGLGSSGAALKGAASFATGLAENTYKTVFDIEKMQRDSIWDRIMGLSGQGANAAAQQGNAAVSTGQGIGQTMAGIGNAQAGAWMNMGQTVGNTANQLAGFAYMQPYMNQLMAAGSPSPAMGWKL